MPIGCVSNVVGDALRNAITCSVVPKRLYSTRRPEISSSRNVLRADTETGSLARSGPGAAERRTCAYWNSDLLGPRSHRGFVRRDRWHRVSRVERRRCRARRPNYRRVVPPRSWNRRNDALLLRQSRRQTVHRRLELQRRRHARPLPQLRRLRLPQELQHARCSRCPLLLRQPRRCPDRR